MAETAYGFVATFIDIYYLQWLAWVIYPLIVTFVLPTLILIGVYVSGIFCHLYRLRHLLREVFHTGDFWDGARKFLAALWDAQGKIWHGIFIFKLHIDILSKLYALVPISLNNILNFTYFIEVKVM